jgi:hypothetical protein
METKDKNFYGTLSITELVDFEETNEIQLPSDYKAFLLDSNGGKPVPNTTLNPPNKVTYILGMHNGPYYASLYKHIYRFKNKLPLSTFPIATDPFGNLFLMTIHPESYGQVYFWDHERTPEVQDGNYTDNCYFVAYSFSEFVNSLVK